MISYVHHGLLSSLNTAATMLRFRNLLDSWSRRSFAFCLISTFVIWLSGSILAAMAYIDMASARDSNDEDAMRWKLFEMFVYIAIGTVATAAVWWGVEDPYYQSVPQSDPEAYQLEVSFTSGQERAKL